jgi:hypothetical protein
VTRTLGDKLPREVVDAFDGTSLREKIGPAYLLLTPDADGTPRPCMLSAGEILAPDDRHLRFGLWTGTHTSENLSRGVPVVFCYVAPGTVLYVRGTSRQLPPVQGVRLARFEVEVGSVESDVHPGMPVTSTIWFEPRDKGADEVAEDWQEQVDALRV